LIVVSTGIIKGLNDKEWGAKGVTAMHWVFD
jgi:hypothetical protein